MTPVAGVVWVAVLLSAACGLNGRVYSPRVLSPHHADAYSLKTFAQFERWRDLEGDAKVYEIFRYLVDPRTGLYPLGVPGWEGDAELSEYGAVRDPVKMLNVYPMGHCGTLGPTAAGILEGMGIGSARTLIIPGWNHVASEVFYGGKWHYFDLDVRAVFRRADGSLASIAEAQQDRSLWETADRARFFPLDPVEQVRRVYEQSRVDHRAGVHSGGHTMDYVLRQGETMILWWKPQGGRWNHHASYGARPFPRELMEQEPRGPKCKHPSFTVHTHGNGRIVYRPDLTLAASDFEDGVYDARNVEVSAEGLTLGRSGAGHAVFEVRTPYVIAPWVGDLDDLSDDREASVVRVDAVGATLDLSMDNGLSWTPVSAPEGVADLTAQVRGRYGYLLRVNLAGEPSRAVLRRMEMVTWVQVHPSSLPALRQGRNLMRLVSGDHDGQPTRVVEVRPDAGKRDEFLRHLVEPPRDYDPARRTSRIRGTFVVKVDAPPGARIEWFSAGGSFATHQGSQAHQTANAMAYAVDRAEGFTEFYKASIPSDQSHWHYNADREVKLEHPARTLYVRYTGDPAVNDIRIYAHCRDEQPRTSDKVVVTHRWRDGVEKVFRTELQPGGAYEIVVEGEPENESIEIALSSGRRAGLRKAGGVEAILDRPVSGEAEWVSAMRVVHKRFTGQSGTLAQIGDSITVSRAFWSPLAQGMKGASSEALAAWETVQKHIQPECWDGKGSELGNEGGKTMVWAAENIDRWLRDMNPEVAVIMFGSNDVAGVSPEDYRRAARRVVEACLAKGTVVLLSTAPPRHGFEEQSAVCAERIREISRDLRVPLIDYHHEIFERRPEDWDGALAKFSAYEGYDVPTLLARDGIHPSNPRQFAGQYGDEALAASGFNLRNYLTLLRYAEVIEKVLSPR